MFAYPDLGEPDRANTLREVYRYYENEAFIDYILGERSEFHWEEK